MFKGTEMQISTAVVNVLTFTEFDVENIFRKIDIDNKIILGAKWHNNYRGLKYNVSQTVCMFNQVTIPIFIKSENKEVNIKVFSNGNLQITGIKNIKQAKLGVDIFIDKIINLKGINKIKLLYKDNIAYNKEEYEYFYGKVKERFNSVKFYNPNTHKQIGEKKGDDFILISKNQRINVLLYKRNELLFIEKSNINISDRIFKKKLFNKLTGNIVGEITYSFKYKRKTIDYNKFNFKKLNDYEYNILDKWSNEIGKEKINIFEEINSTDDLINEIDVIFNCLTKTNNKEHVYNMTNINSNFQITTLNHKKFLFLREKLNNIFIEKYNLNSSCRLDCKYQAIKLHLSYDKDYNLIPVSSTQQEVYSNSLSIFENGQTLVFGSTSNEQMMKVKTDLLKIINEIDTIIIKQEKIKIKIQDPTLDIWDFIKN